ncbi:MAG: hypothetical protein COW52_06150 [Nitrospirae bacterium CG17_big_fil_post_rev_8_21_14_2_50_50_9]|nr:MAG: hypothetical protein COW52_06150 [Nitrospirae bacterium CG17_big_fil_post_rev_8_21_14_2_50_50_9]PIW85769.1 MAG: hypothetical protein COZ95_02795 [Nitrospirae bacterium CG_4_8_14_3_um_filter_50_41]
MKQITLRGIPEKVKKAVQKEAERKGLSLNRAFISLLSRTVSGTAREKKVIHHDLDHLAGLWSREESTAFDKYLGIQRKVDEELWKKSK